MRAAHPPAAGPLVRTGFLRYARGMNTAYAHSRRVWIVTGQVQGVGFRPYVWRLARELGLTGTVRNTADGVRIEAQGTPGAVAAFGSRLRAEAPPLARIRSVTDEVLPVLPGETEFRILESEGRAGHTVLVSPDVGICDACLAEMRDPANRRHGYAFTNCTDCGPRFTITRSIPYDRAVTSMACFPLCADCAREYANPADRRFHAQPVACPVCGPRLWYVDADAARAGRTAPPEPADAPEPFTTRHATDGEPAGLEDARRRDRAALDQAARLLRGGGILALKGLGGFQLLCNARDPAAVVELRRRKQRPHKALAVMAADLDSAAKACELSPGARALLSGPEKPIVLCPRLPASAAVDAIAPDTSSIGLMLPCTPLHAALCDRLAAQGEAHPLLVATSGNPPGEPLCLGNREALARLAPLADAWLLHDRDILVRADDSVAALMPGAPGEAAQPLLFRRARGYVPRPVLLPAGMAGAGCVLGAGAELKATFCLARGGEAFVGQHLGDLENPAVLTFYEQALAHLEALLAVRPEAVVCDLHPDFLSSRYAEERAAREGLRLWRLQHHAAHAASVLAENGHCGPALALCLDGTGLGPDGTVWGGELLWMELATPAWRRVGRLAPFALPGGEAAIREPWRIARALGLACGLAPDRLARPQPDAAPGGPARPGETAESPGAPGADAATAMVDAMLRRGFNCPSTSSCGRLFDAVAAGLGLCQTISYEGQAAVRLERAAEARWRGHGLPADAEARWPEPVLRDGLWELDSATLFRESVDRANAAGGAEFAALCFHLALARGLAALCREAAQSLGVREVGLSGGVVQNGVLTRLLRSELARAGLRALVHHEVPPGDGGLALGQAVWGQRLLLAERGAGPRS